MSLKTVFCAFRSVKSGYEEVAYSSPSPPLVKTSTRVEGELTGSGRNSSESTSENIAVLTPTPRASEPMATAKKPGLRASPRSA